MSAVAPVAGGRPAGGFMPQLDTLRAVAVMAVVAHHYLDPKALEAALGASPGLLGVRLFFVLSGFLITGILLRARHDIEDGRATRGEAVRQFYIRRSLRIFPLYYLVLAVAWAIGDAGVREQLPWLATYTYNVWVADLGWFPAHFSHFWSLAVEEQFYLVWPAAILWVPRRWLVPLLVGVVAVSPLYRAYAWSVPLEGLWFYVITPANLDALGMGALLSAITAGGPPDRRVVHAGLAMGVLGAIGWALVQPYAAGQAIIMETMVSLVLAAFVAVAAVGVRGPLRRVLEWRPVLYVGKVSYGIYVYHLFVPAGVAAVASACGYALDPEGGVHFVLCTAITIVVATISWYAFERPFAALKRGFPYSHELKPT